MKKQSSTKRPPEFTFFTDRDLGNTVPDILRGAGLPVEKHDDHFGPRTPDTEWLRVVGLNDWVALTHNKRIRYNLLEQTTVMRARVRLLVLVGNASHRELAMNFVQTVDKVLRFLGEHHPPFIARVYRPTPVALVSQGVPGRVELWV